MSALELLSQFWEQWCKDNGIEPVDADELILDSNLTSKQRQTVTRFIQLWEAVQ